MSNSSKVNHGANIAGVAFSDQLTANVDRALCVQETLAVAKVGQLTTRTDADTGVLTMAASHGITTGAILDVYWVGGMRLGMTVGTVSVNSVPIDGGVGDNLPTNMTAITAQVEVAFNLDVGGAGGSEGLQALVISMSQVGSIIFSDGSDTLRINFYTAGTMYDWYLGKPGTARTDPLTAASVAATSFKVTQGNSAQTCQLKIGLAFDG